jgi:hypothetical protein
MTTGTTVIFKVALTHGKSAVQARSQRPNPANVPPEFGRLEKAQLKVKNSMLALAPANN